MDRKLPIALTSLGYLILFGVITNLGLYWLGYHPSKALRGDWLNISLALGFVGGFTGLVVALCRKQAAPEATPTRVTAWQAALPFACVAGLLAFFWPFDLDDKWIYYRISANVLKSGLPLWNADEPIFVGASFLYPYLLAPGHFLGDWPVWEIFQKASGALTHLLCAAVIVRHFRGSPMGWTAGTAILLFMPAALWSLGGLDVTFATLWLLLALGYYLRTPGSNVVFWFLCGCMMWIRPDGILVGVGAWLLQFLREPRALGRHFVRGIAFSAPILAYLAVNYVKSGLPLPTVFYVKGWNKAFSGNYPLYYDMYIGGTHMLSAILTSAGVTLFVALAIMNVSRLVRFERQGWLWRGDGPRAANADALLGATLYLGYHVVGGYQHMNFAFRYWLPGIVCVAFISADLLRDRPDASADQIRGGRLAARLARPPTFLLFVTALTLQAFSIGYFAKHIDITPTIAPLRDRFSVMSYAGYIRSWMEAGNHLRTKVGPNDRIFLYAGMASGAFTEAYLVDQFYLPPHLTKFADLRETMPQPPRYDNVLANYDYVLTNPKQMTLETHEIDREFATITVLKRKDLGSPVAPGSAAGFRVDGTTFQLSWEPAWNNLGYIIEARTGGDPYREVGRALAGYSQFRAAGFGVGQSVHFRIRGINSRGVSPPSSEFFIE